jgi:hypothetical protein
MRGVRVPAVTWREALASEYAWIGEHSGAISEAWIAEYVEKFLDGQGVPVPDDSDERHQLVNAAVHIIAPALTDAVETAAWGNGFGKDRWTLAEILEREREEV